MATTGSVVNDSMGAMRPVLGKLTTLMGEEYKKYKGLRDELRFLIDELSVMHAYLVHMDGADEVDPSAENWRKDIVDMSYDIEDYINDLMCVGESDNKGGVLLKVCHYLKTMKDRYRLANQIKKIKIRVIQTSQHRERYKLDLGASSTTTVLDPRLLPLYTVDSAALVGIETQKAELVKWAVDEEQQLKVASIVGLGGLGKTTLANEVYRKVGVQFNCLAFVSISQKPIITRLLNSISSQLGLHTNSYVDVSEIIDHIRQYLQDKRYFVVLDDLWDIQAWNIISCAFPHNDQHSRVMITTRIENVAAECCGHNGCILAMGPLSEQDSRKLFFSRIFGSEDFCPPQLIEVSCKILKKCGGLPLAITTVSSILACQPAKRQWEYLQSSLATEFAESSLFEDMMRILDLSYKFLPSCLKPCFLYLCIYPKDHKITRVELVRRWVAEGFVSYSPGQDVWDVAESYFNELVNRSMIQLVYEDGDNMVSHCRVHDMMLELIVRRCREDNFISLIDPDSQLMVEGQDKVIRRLMIDFSGVEYGTMVRATPRRLSQVRSVNIFGISKWMPPLHESKLLQVLCLDYGAYLITSDMTGINQFSQLRYLKIQGSNVNIVLPAKIQGLRLLETIDLSKLKRNSYSLPEFVDMPCFSHLAVDMDGFMRLPNGVCKVKSLRSLSGFSLLLSSLENIMGLGELTALSELHLSCRVRTMGDVPLLIVPYMTALSTSLQNLNNLKFFSLLSACGSYCPDALLSSLFLHPIWKLERLNLGCLAFSCIPTWIEHLQSLRELRLRVKQILQEDIDIIGSRLPCLVNLELRDVRGPPEMIMIGDSTGFHVLECFILDCDAASYLTFEAGAMPRLWKLELAINAHKWDKAAPVGLQHLRSLKKIEIFAAPPTGTWEENALMEGVFRKAAGALPTYPAFTFVNPIFRLLEENNFGEKMCAWE